MSIEGYLLLCLCIWKWKDDSEEKDKPKHALENNSGVKSEEPAVLTYLRSVKVGVGLQRRGVLSSRRKLLRMIISPCGYSYNNITT